MISMPKKLKDQRNTERERIQQGTRIYNKNVIRTKT